MTEKEWVLLLDDDADFRRLVSTILTTLGYSVYECSTTAEANNALSMKAPVLTIVDYRLPDMDGLTWISSAREQGHDFPVVCVSANWMDVQKFDRMRNLLGVSLVLQKPIVPELFIEQLESIIPVDSRVEPQPVVAPPVKLGGRRERMFTSGEMSFMLRQEIRHPKSVQEALLEARKHYAIELPTLVKDLAQGVRSAKESKNTAAFAVATRAAHKLRGSAGSFGFHSIGEGAAKIENLLHNLEQDDSTLQEILWSEIIRYLSEIESAAKQAALSFAPEGVSPPKVLARHVLCVGDPGEWTPLTRQIESTDVASVTVAASWADAVNAAQQARPDVLFIDLAQVPKNDASGLAAGIRTIDGCESIPLALVCPSGVKLEPAEALFIGASAIFNGPMVDVTLISAAQSLIAIREVYMPRILTVDDDEVLGGFIKSVLSAEGMVVRALPEAIKIFEVMEEFMPDVLLLDVVMPGISGYDICRLIRESEKWSELPVLFLTSKTGAEGRASALKAGGDDFLGKPVVTEELVICVKKQLDRAKSYQHRLEKDVLTGLLQRTPFERATTSMVNSARGRGVAVTLGLIEVSDFRDISCTFGLGVGEQILAALAKLVRTRFRAEDVRARLGDFVVLVCPGQGLEAANAALELLRHEFEGISFNAPDGSTFSASVNYGTAQLGRGCEDAFGLIKVASQALLSHK